jgi:hypothetical protein
MRTIRHLALLALSGALPAMASPAATLADVSPFLPRGMAGAQGTQLSSDVPELRGVMSGASGNLYYVYDPTKKRGVWTGLNDTENPFQIVAADAVAGSLAIRTGDGRILHLTLREAKTQSGGPDSQGTSEPAATLVAADSGPSTVRLTEAQRAWREEFRRRQAENAASN